MEGLFAELKRRNVVRVASVYVILSRLMLQIGDLLFNCFEVPTICGDLTE